MTSKFLLPVFLFSLLISTLAHPAFAKNALINDAGAKRLMDVLQKTMAERKKAATDIGGELVTSGKITIEQSDTYYAATLPEMIIKAANNDEIKIGLVAINATPVKDSEDWKMSVALPTPIVIKNATDNSTKRIDIGSQKSGGVWAKSMDGFSTFIGEYKNVVLTNETTNDVFNIGSLSLNSDFAEKENKWGGKSAVTLQNVSFDNATQKNVFSFENLKMLVTMRDYDFKSFKQIIQNSTSPDLVNNLINIQGNMSSDIVIDKIKINTPKMAELKGFDSLKLGFSSTPSNDGKLDQKTHISYIGLDLNNASPSDEVIPRNFQTKIDLENLPLQEIIDLGTQFTASGAAENKAVKQLAVMQAMLSLPQTLMKASTALKLSDTLLSTSEYTFSLDGDAMAAAGAETGFVGSADMKVQGLTKVIEKLEKEPDSAALVKQLKLFKKLSDYKDGRHELKLVLKPSGKIMANNDEYKQRLMQKERKERNKN